MRLLVEDKSLTEISSALHVSYKTVHTHKANLMNKLDIQRIGELKLFFRLIFGF